MLDKDTFKAVVLKELKNHLPEEYKNNQVKLSNVVKTNRTVETITLEPDTAGSFRISPNFHVDDLYQRYQHCGDIDMVLDEMAETIDRTISNPVDISRLENPEYFKQNVVMQLINTESNREMLADAPHREVHDCSVVYRVVVDLNETGLGTVLVKNDMLKNYNMTEEELFEAARENTKRILPAKIEPLSHVLMGAMPFSDDLPFDLGELMAHPEEELWLVTNTKGVNGAVQMLYAENLQKVADKVGNDIFVIPSSIHEVLCMSRDMGDIEEISNMVNEVNREQVDLKDRLSNQVYFYDRTKRTLTMVTDNPNRGIYTEADKVAEKAVEYAAQEKTR